MKIGGARCHGVQSGLPVEGDGGRVCSPTQSGQLGLSTCPVRWCLSRDPCICVTWLIHMCECVAFLRVLCVYVCDMTHVYVYASRSSFTCVRWLIQMCDMTHSYVWHGSFSGLSMCRVHLCARYDPFHMSHDPFICVSVWPFCEACVFMCVIWHVAFVTRPIHTCECVASLQGLCVYACGMTHVYVWHDSFKCVSVWPLYVSCAFMCMIWPITFVTHPIHMCECVTVSRALCVYVCCMTHVHAWHDSFICVSVASLRVLRVDGCDVTLFYVWHDLIIHVSVWLLYMSYEWVMSHI